jgi:hypothetical protein
MKLLNFKPILFQPEMVKANLDGRKTETRRLNGLELINQHPDDWKFLKFETDPEFITGVDKMDNNIVKTFPGLYAEFAHIDGDFEMYRNIKCPYGNVGDILWVRETYGKSNDGKIHYAANYCSPKYDKPDGGWKPSIHMPKQACRIFLLLKEVKVERLLDITEEGAIAEGVQKGRCLGHGAIGEETYREGFLNLFLKINGSIKENPWVWVLKYELLTTNGIEDLKYVLLKKFRYTHLVYESIDAFLTPKVTMKRIAK